jgi:hypothetical protein
VVEGALNAPFAQSTALFEGMVKKLSGDDVLALRHDALETLVRGEGRELLRQLIQDHVALRHAREEPLASVSGADDVERTHVRERGRKLVTLFGEVEVDRLAYGQRGTDSLMPLDAQLNLSADSFSHGVRKRAALAVSLGSFDVATDLLQRDGIEVEKRQVEMLAQRAAVDFDAYYAVRDQLAAGEPPSSPDEPTFLVISTDAKGIVMRPDALREETRKKAATTVRKLETRLSKGEPANRKRNAQVAAVYDVKPYVRRIEDIVLLTRRVPDDKRPAPPRATNKRVWASVEKNALTVIVEAFEEAKRRDPTFSRPWAVLVDGSVDQLDSVKRIAKQMGVEPTIVCDLIHVLQYLWKAGHCFERESSPELEKYVLDRLYDVLDGKAVDVAAGMRRSATLRKLKGKKRSTVDQCADYLLNHKQFLDYPSYMKRGLPITTGVIEGTVRHLVNDRMDITGARWGLNGAEAILRLRALYSSHDFDEYWAFHMEQEHMRNHGSRYTGNAAPVVLRPAKYKRGKDHLKLLMRS